MGHLEAVTVTQDFVMAARALAQPLAVDAGAARASEGTIPRDVTGDAIRPIHQCQVHR